MAVPFPSTEFFSELARLMRERRPLFEKLGFCDCTLGVRVTNGTPALYALRFEVYECTEVRELDDASAAELDFVLEAPRSVWREQIEAIRKHGGAPPEYTLNTLSHLGDRMKVVYTDPEAHDKFYRYMATLQAFFDLAAEVDVETA